MVRSSLTQNEKVMYALRDIYESCGYTQYKMNKFEEYDLYVRNKSFLLSDHIIAFTDTDGKLMALKPDVTLSIVKNIGENEVGVRRVYYNENVYRVPKGGFSFKEIMQSGLECIGELDNYSVTEVLMLAAKSLSEISPDFVLDISHLGIISALIESMNIGGEAKGNFITAVGEKNIHTLGSLSREYSIDPEKTDLLKALVSINGECSEMLDILKESEFFKQAEEFSEIITVLKNSFGNKIRIDFSVVDDMRYYNGIVFKGFVKGIPTSVLSGGRYDRLMQRMGKKSGAIGFAIYLDLLEELGDIKNEFDADVFLKYSEKTQLALISEKTEELIKCGKRVVSGKKAPDKLKFKEMIEL